MQKYKTHGGAFPIGSLVALVGSSSSPLSRHPSSPLRPCRERRGPTTLCPQGWGRGLMDARSGTLTDDHLQPRILSDSPAQDSVSKTPKRLSMYSLAKELGTLIVSVSSSRRTGTIPSNHILSEETSISSWTSPRRRPHSSSACGSGTGAAGGG